MYTSLKDMAFFTGSEVRGSMQWIITFAGLFFLILPISCTASTLPVQPSLLFDIPNLSAGQNTTVTLSVTWNGYSPFNKPPEEIIVDVFSVPDGSQLGSVPLPKMVGGCTSENTCRYHTSVDLEDFPSGTLMLIAADPLSGSTNRQMIFIPLHDDGNSEFFKQSEHDQRFLLTSAMVGVFLVFVLAILVRKKI
jgi:hypothetical protein